MTQTDISRPTILELIPEFSEHHLLTGTPSSRKRLIKVMSHLTTYLEEEGDAFLTHSSRRILDAETELDPIAPFVRTMHADDLFYSLPHYLGPGHSFVTTMDRRAQIEIVVHLADWMRGQGYVDDRSIDECIGLDVASAVKRARQVPKA
jgi:hypothetical protein